MIPEPKVNHPEEYKETVCKFETLACFCQKKQETLRKTNEKLAEKVEIALFPQILENSINTPPNTPEKEKYIISVSGKRRNKFYHKLMKDYLIYYKKEILLGYMEIDTIKKISRFVHEDGSIPD